MNLQPTNKGLAKPASWYRHSLNTVISQSIDVWCINATRCNLPNKHLGAITIAANAVQDIAAQCSSHL
jgi:hypothetical protein